MERCGDCTGQSGSKVGQVNRHLSRSYDANFKIMVVSAAEVSNNCQAAKKYGVTECNVRRWWVQKDRLKNTNSKRKACSSPQSQFWLSEPFSEVLNREVVLLSGSSYIRVNTVLLFSLKKLLKYFTWRRRWSKLQKNNTAKSATLKRGNM